MRIEITKDGLPIKEIRLTFKLVSVTLHHRCTMLTTALVAPSLETREFTGAGDESRTRDPRLGKTKNINLIFSLDFINSIKPRNSKGFFFINSISYIVSIGYCPPFDHLFKRILLILFMLINPLDYFFYIY